MQGCAPFSVNRIDVETFAGEEGDGDRLIALSGDMEQIDTLCIYHVEAGTMVAQKPSYGHAAVKGCEVQRCEALLTRAPRVQPFREGQLASS